MLLSFLHRFWWQHCQFCVKIPIRGKEGFQICFSLFLIIFMNKFRTYLGIFCFYYFCLTCVEFDASAQVYHDYFIPGHKIYETINLFHISTLFCQIDSILTKQPYMASHRTCDCLRHIVYRNIRGLSDL